MLWTINSKALDSETTETVTRLLSTVFVGVESYLNEQKMGQFKQHMSQMKNVQKWF